MNPEGIEGKTTHVPITSWNDGNPMQATSPIIRTERANVYMHIICMDLCMHVPCEVHGRSSKDRPNLPALTPPHPSPGSPPPNKSSD